jgi:hypothetical protein
MTRCIRLGAVALVVAALTVLAGCHGKSPAAPSATASGPNEAQIVAILQEYTQCMRDHSIPSFQQPKLVNGKIQWDKSPAGVDLDTLDAAVEACKPIAKKLPDGISGRQKDPTAAELDKLRQFAMCMRQHGFPDFPDPDSRGRFAIEGTPMERAVGGKGGNRPSEPGEAPPPDPAIQPCMQHIEGMDLRVKAP